MATQSKGRLEVGSVLNGNGRHTPEPKERAAAKKAGAPKPKPAKNAKKNGKKNGKRK